MKILIAEDEPTLLENLQLMLQMEGYEVLTACDGAQAIDVATQHRPDLVISDVMMPKLNGYDVVKALRENEATALLPVILLTAKADRNDVRLGMTLGADDYLVKPYRRDELLDAIEARRLRSGLHAKAGKKHQQEIRQALQIDPLTALPNRVGFEQWLERAILQPSNPADGCITVICVGLDGFSRVNDSLGSFVGDLVLQQVASRFSDALRSSPDVAIEGHLARLSGDCFGICHRYAPDQALLAQRLKTFLNVMTLPFVVQGHRLHLSVCAGASQARNADDSARKLLLTAESALRKAKNQGPGVAKVFDGTMNQQTVRQLNIHNELHHAIENDHLMVYYHPQIHIATGRLVGFEALSRWKHATLGWISPSEFIPIAEESGMIIPLGDAILKRAAQQAKQWFDQGRRDFCVAVNLSVRQFTNNELPKKVEQVLAATGIAPHMLELEVTESLAMQSVGTTLSTLHALKSLGVKLSMDDFGTGYSSLAYLKRYPLDTLKIDQSFVRNITQDEGDAAITRAIVAMAHSFGMSVIAEGVETVAQLAFLRDLGCEHFQGYLFSKPIPASLASMCFSGYQVPHATP